MVTNETRTRVSLHDYLPFGEEIPANTAGRDGNFGGFENVRQRFTGQERDETNLDYFQARYYGGALGRFTSPDPLNAGADLLNPQSWNAYSYVVNRPLTYIDPQGTSFLNALGDFFSGLGGGIASGLGFGTQSCGADFCTTGTGHPDVNPVDIFSGGGLVFGGGGLSNSGGRGGSGMPNFTTTGYGKADVPTVGGTPMPPKTGTQQQQPSTDWSKVSSCLASSAANHYGLTAATGISGLLALPIPKAIVPPFKVIGTPTTNILSILGRYVDISIPSITIAGRTSGNLLRVAGRANPYVFAGLLAIDAGVIGYNTYNCYQQSGQPGVQEATNGLGGPQ